MPQFTETIVIDAPRSEVWRTLADLEAVESYSPGVKRASYTSREREGVGAGRHCDFHGPGRVHERVVESVDGERLGIQIEKGFPARNVVAEFRLTDQVGETRGMCTSATTRGSSPWEPSSPSSCCGRTRSRRCPTSPRAQALLRDG